MPHPSRPAKVAPNAAHKAAEKRGRIAERAATLWLRIHGYTLLERRFRTKVGEIDLIAEKGGTLIFVEVKRRKTAAAALEAVTYTQRRRIEAAAQLYMQRRSANLSVPMVDAAAGIHRGASTQYWPQHWLKKWLQIWPKRPSNLLPRFQLNQRSKHTLPHNHGTICRFDVIAIAPWSIPVHIKGAWRMGP
mgnify:CR=1 FL=1